MSFYSQLVAANDDVCGQVRLLQRALGNSALCDKLGTSETTLWRRMQSPGDLTLNELRALITVAKSSGIPFDPFRMLPS